MGRLLVSSAPGLTGRGLQFIALAGFAALTDPASYGRFVAVQGIVVGLASIVGSTMGASANAVAARCARDSTASASSIMRTVLRGRRRQLARNAGASSALVTLGYVVVVGVPSDGRTIGVLVAIGLAGGSVPAAETAVAVLAGAGRRRAASWLDAGRATVGAAAAVVSGVSAGPLAAVLGLLSADVLLTAVVLVTIVRSGAPEVVVDTAEVREGLVPGVAANVIGQVANWIVLWAVHVVAGQTGLGVYGVAMRFASVVTIAPQYFGKMVIGELAAPAPGRDAWTGRSFLVLLGVLTGLSSGIALVVAWLASPLLRPVYPDLFPVLCAVLLAVSIRAVLIGLGQLCIARRLWTVWLVADGASLVATVIGVAGVLAVGTPMPAVVSIVLVAAAGNAVGVAVRLAGARRRPTGRGGAAQ